MSLHEIQFLFRALGFKAVRDTDACVPRWQLLREYTGAAETRSERVVFKDQSPVGVSDLNGAGSQSTALRLRDEAAQGGVLCQDRLRRAEPCEYYAPKFHNDTM